MKIWMTTTFKIQTRRSSAETIELLYFLRVFVRENTDYFRCIYNSVFCTSRTKKLLSLLLFFAIFDRLLSEPVFKTLTFVLKALCKVSCFFVCSPLSPRLQRFMTTSPASTFGYNLCCTATIKTVVVLLILRGVLQKSFL